MGFLRFAGRMGSVNLVVIVESVQSLIMSQSGDLKQFHIPSIVAVAAALGEFFSSPCGPWLIIIPQGSNLFYFSTASRFEKSRVKSKFCGRITGTTCFSMDSVRFSFQRVKKHTSYIIWHAGILMSTGGSKLRWCLYLIHLTVPMQPIDG